MSEKKNEAQAAVPLDPMEELVDFTAPFDPTDSRGEVLLGVNGQVVRVKRGATVRLKRKFVQAWEDANAQAAAARETMDRARRSGRAPMLEM